jgi:hypothetical protein
VPFPTLTKGGEGDFLILLLSPLEPTLIVGSHTFITTHNEKNPQQTPCSYSSIGVS